MWPVVLAAALVTGALVAVLPDEDAEGDAGDTREEVAAGFVAAYDRSRTATFAADQTFTRTPPEGGEGLAYDRRLVQRPPDDRLLVGGGAAEGRVDGRVVRCSTGPDGTSRCDEGPLAPGWDDEVAAEVEDLRALVEGDRPVYEVRPGEPGCWSLHLRLDVPSPPYGTFAGFCFDAATGAPTRFEVRRPEATDLVVTTSIRTEVTASDLRPGDLGDLPGP